MVRLEFFKVDKKDLKDFLHKLIEGGEVYEKYTDKDGNEQKKLRVKNNRMYFGNNQSVRVNSDDNNYYFSLEYFAADDRIKMSKGFDNADSQDVY